MDNTTDHETRQAHRDGLLTPAGNPRPINNTGTRPTSNNGPALRQDSAGTQKPPAQPKSHRRPQAMNQTVHTPPISLAGILTGLLITAPLWAVTMYASSISLPHLLTVALSLALTAGISIGYTSSLRRRPEPTAPEAPPATMLTTLCLALGAPALLLAQLSPPHLAIILAAAVCRHPDLPGRRRPGTGDTGRPQTPELHPRSPEQNHRRPGHLHPAVQHGPHTDRRIPLELKQRTHSPQRPSGAVPPGTTDPRLNQRAKENSHGHPAGITARGQQGVNLERHQTRTGPVLRAVYHLRNSRYHLPARQRNFRTRKLRLPSPHKVHNHQRRNRRHRRRNRILNNHGGTEDHYGSCQIFGRKIPQAPPREKQAGSPGTGTPRTRRPMAGMARPPTTGPRSR